jgi:predicted DCC family thiol-disulfide oxidoreductase YuxK
MPAPVRVFYDGDCGLCHGFVRFLVARDRVPGGAFRFAPLHGETFRKEIPEERRAGLPDSVVVVAPDGKILVKSEAVFHVLERLGGSWPGWAKLFRLKSRFGAALLYDLVYDLVAGTRRMFFRRPDDVCPVVPANLRDRFDP